MDPVTSSRFRRRVAADMPDVYRVFRRSLYDYLHRTGQVDAAAAADPPIEEPWARQRAWMEHLAATASEDWVAEEPGGRIVGWAQSVEREGLLELTLFFVDPGAQSRGIGRGLLERAFPLGRGDARAIVATQDPRALGLYFKFGVTFAGTSVDFLGRPRASGIATDLTVEPVRAGGETEAATAILEIERALLGHGRLEDIRFLLADRPAWLARREGRAVGVAFGASGGSTGPLAALDPADLPALLATVENDAASRGLEELSFSVPLANSTALGHVLERGFKIDPFYTLILSSGPGMHLDRWVHTQPNFIV
jgi:ribosomal protein S18 acetylase RimI-like enzyme